MAHQIITFLRKLSENNHKEWFDEHRDEYEKARTALIEITTQLIKGINGFDPSLGHLEAKKCLFRQNRDIRFSTNKQPYKTTMSAFLTKGGKNSGNAGYYIHFEPDKSFIGGGIYAPEAAVLKAIRTEIYFNLPQWEQIIYGEAFVKKFGSIMNEGKLQRPPKGFPADFPGIEFLKFKHFVVGMDFNPDRFSNPEIIDLALESFRIMHPFNDFLNNALLNAGDE